MRKLRAAIKETAIYGIVGGAATAFTSGAITSAVLTFAVLVQPSSVNIRVIEELFTSVALACLAALPGGFIMGVMAALTRSWTYSGVIAGIFYIGWGSIIAFGLIFMVSIVGVIMDAFVGNPRWLWTRRLHELSEESPLKNLPAIWHVSLGIGLPVLWYILLGTNAGAQFAVILRQMTNVIRSLFH